MTLTKLILVWACLMSVTLAASIAAVTQGANVTQEAKVTRLFCEKPTGPSWQGRVDDHG